MTARKYSLTTLGYAVVATLAMTVAFVVVAATVMLSFSGCQQPTREIKWLDPGAGADGTPGTVVSIGDNGNWFLDGVDTGLLAVGQQGPQGETGPQGDKGEPGDFIEAATIAIGANGNWFIDGIDTGYSSEGQVGPAGAPGTVISLGTNGNWYLDGKDTGIKAAGSNGKDGQPGQNGANGKDGETGPQGPQGNPGQDGQPGRDGSVITIGSNGNWFIDGIDSGINAVIRLVQVRFSTYTMAGQIWSYTEPGKYINPPEVITEVVAGNYIAAPPKPAGYLYCYDSANWRLLEFQGWTVASGDKAPTNVSYMTYYGDWKVDTGAYFWVKFPDNVNDPNSTKSIMVTVSRSNANGNYGDDIVLKNPEIKNRLNSADPWRAKDFRFRDTNGVWYNLQDFLCQSSTYGPNPWTYNPEYVFGKIFQSTLTVELTAEGKAYYGFN